MDYVEKRQIVHALSRRRRPGACAAKRFAEGKTLPQGGFTPPEDLNRMGPQTNEVCLGVDDLKPFDAMEFAEALI